MPRLFLQIFVFFWATPLFTVFVSNVINWNPWGARCQ